MPTFPFNHNLIKIGKRKYRNLIYLAREWRKGIDNGEYPSAAELGRHFHVSKARVTQILNLMELSSEAIIIISSLGDPLKSPLVAERKLRPLLALTTEQQTSEVKIMFSNGRRKNLH